MQINCYQIHAALIPQLYSIHVGKRRGFMSGANTPAGTSCCRHRVVKHAKYLIDLPCPRKNSVTSPVTSLITRRVMVSRYEPRYEPHYEGRDGGTKGFASKDILVFFQGIDPRGDRSGAPNGLVMVARNGASKAEVPDQPQLV